MYADQESGLGVEEVRMESSTGGSGEDGEDGKVGLWMDLVEEWEKNGKKGNGPPGTRENEVYVMSAAAGDRDYVLLRPGYALNPEVRFLCFLISAFRLS